MEDNVPCIKIKFSLPEISRKKGSIRIRWLGSVSKKPETLREKAWEVKQAIGMRGV